MDAFMKLMKSNGKSLIPCVAIKLKEADCMKSHHVKRIWSRPLFMKWGKHVCPVCGETLKKVKFSRIVNSDSEEAKSYDFSSAGGDGYLTGDVKFIGTEFSCGKCGKRYSADDIYQAEKAGNK